VPAPRSLLEEIRADFRAGDRLAVVAAGVVAGVVSLAIAVAFAALIFSGDLSPHLPIGIGIAFFGTVAVGVVMALRSSLPGVVAGCQDVPAAILAVAAASIVAATGADPALPTVIATIALTSGLMGVTFLVLGHLRAGNLVRYLPYPVVGGFIAGTGWIIVVGSVGILSGGAALGDAVTGEHAAIWIPGLVIAVGFHVIPRVVSHHLTLPLLVLAIPVVYQLGFALTGTTAGEAAERGLVLGGVGGEARWSPDVLTIAVDADWGAVASQAGALATIIALAAVALLLYLGGLELELDLQADVNQDLRAAGWGSLLGSLGGGLPGYVYLSDSLLAARISGPRRGAALIAAGMSVVALVVGPSLLTVIPTAMIGGLLLFLGSGFLIDWLWESRRRLPLHDRGLVAVIVVSIAVWGFLPGVAVGLAIAILLFVTRASGVAVVRHAAGGDSYRSTVDRSLADEGLLDREGRRILVLELQGFLFFGTAGKVFDTARAHVDQAEERELRWVVCDFARVTGVDSSALMSFRRLQRLGAGHGFAVVLSGVGTMQGLFDSSDEAWTIGSDLDHALEWCEDRVIAEFGGQLGEAPLTLRQQLALVLGDERVAERLAGEFDRIEVAAGGTIFHSGDPAPGLHFLETGEAVVQMDGPSGPIRLRRLQPGTIVGEISLYLGSPATASVIADTEVTALRLPPGRLDALLDEDPRAAALLHRYLATTLALRVTRSDDTIRTLRR
jgi:sulfate permease, SulP family